MTFRADRVGRRLRTLEKVEVDCRVVGSGTVTPGCASQASTSSNAASTASGD